MHQSVLAIQRARLSRLFSDIQGQSFSNPKLEEHVKELAVLFANVESQINLATSKPNVKKSDISHFDIVINFLLDNIEYLEDSVMDTIPFETIFCLETALKDWIKDNYIIVVTFKRGEYFFSSFLSSEQMYNYIEIQYNIKLTHKLIQISIPKYEVNDYLFNVVLYHELGHFVDIKYNISSKIIGKNFSGLSIEERRIKKSHYAEYFSDIFAAQYISRYSSVYLDYFAGDDPDSYSHPSTLSRSRVVDDFLNNIENPIIKLIQETTSLSTGIDVGIKYESFDTKDIIDLIPANIQRTAQLHYVFIAGWELWLNEREMFPVKDNAKLYKIINNLLEKTISNYMVTSVWESANLLGQEQNNQAT